MTPEARTIRRVAASLVMALVFLASCGGPAGPQIILPGRLDLDVAPGDELRESCPSEVPGAEKGNAIDCILGPAHEAFKPYAAALKDRGWTSSDQQTWLGPQDAEGVHGCLIVRSYQSNFTKRERTVLEFELVDPAIGCPAGGGAHAFDVDRDFYLIKEPKLPSMRQLG